jgi:WD40 repeat protein
MNVVKTLFAAIGATAIVAGPQPIIAAEQKLSGPISYYRGVRPILQENCQGCHQPAKREGGFVITSLQGMKKGGDSGEPGVVPGDPEKSTLISEITADAGRKPAMPKGRDPLTATQVALVRRWIQEGAIDDTPATAGTKLDASHPPKYASPPVTSALAFSRDGTLLAVSGFHEVLLHAADGSAIVGRLVGLSERIQSLAFSPDGKRLAVAGGSPVRMGEVQVWDVPGRKLTLSCPVTFDTVYGARWSGDGKLVAFGCADNTVRAIDAASGKQVLFQGAHDDWVLDTAFSIKGTHLVSVSRDGSMKLTEVATQRFVDNITSITPGALKGGLISVDRHPTKDELLVGGADGEPKIYQMFRTKDRVIGDDFNLIRKFDPLPGRVYAVSYFANGARIAAASSYNGRGELRVYQAGDGKLVSRFEVPEGGLFALACHPDGHRIAAGGFDGMVRLVDADSGKLIKRFVAVPLELGKVAKATH